MDSQNANLVILSRAELISALNVLNKEEPTGTQSGEDELSKDLFTAILEEGNQRLVARNLAKLSSGDNQIQLTPDLARFIQPMILKDLVLQLILGVKGKGQFPVSYYWFEDVFVEQLIHDENTHILRIFSDLADFFRRIDELIPLRSVIREGRQIIEIEQSNFDDLIQLSREKETGTQKIVKALEKLQVKEDLALKFAAALSRPVLTLSMALVLYQDENEGEASSFSIFADQDSSWGVWPNDTNSQSATYWVMPSGLNDVHSALIDWFGIRDELLEQLKSSK